MKYIKAKSSSLRRTLESFWPSHGTWRILAKYLHWVPLLCFPDLPGPAHFAGLWQPFYALFHWRHQLFPVHDLLLNWSPLSWGSGVSSLELRPVAAAMLIYVPVQLQLSNVLTQIAGHAALRFDVNRIDSIWYGFWICISIRIPGLGPVVIKWLGLTSQGPATNDQMTKWRSGHWMLDKPRTMPEWGRLWIQIEICN